MPKRTQRTPTWSIVFEDAAQLRSIVDAVSTVMARVSFKVVKRDGKHVLEVDSADVAMMCCVSARLVLDKVVTNEEGEDEGFSFCVDCKHFASAIETPSCAHLALTMLGLAEESKIVLTMHEPEQHAHEASSEVSLYMEEEHDPLVAMDFDMLLEVDLSLLREMIKKARKAHTEKLRICVYLQEVAQKKISLVVFSIEGDFTHEQKFCHETTRDDDGSTIVRAATDGTHKLLDTDATEPAFEGVFPAEKIDAFVKNLPCRMLTAKIKTGMPLMLDYPLGGTCDDVSHIRFLVAAVNEDV